jgi:hypothetical protein
MDYAIKGWLNNTQVNEFVGWAPTAAGALSIGRSFAVHCSSFVTIRTPEGVSYSVPKFSALLDEAA